jgi:excinuclease ABC subunit A
MGRFTAIKGIEHVKGVRLIDQQPIGRTPRSNPVTYLKVFDEIRQLFAAERDALRQGFSRRAIFRSTPKAADVSVVKGWR